MKNLPIKYKSQWDGDAGATNNDCGPCDIAMILNFYGENLTTDQVFEKTGAGSGLISWPQLQKAITAFGYTSHLERNSNLDRIRQLIENETPPIILVHYGSLNSTQDKTFKGGHFFVPVGYYENGFYVNDSNFRFPIRSDGDHHNYLISEIEKAWKDCSIDENQPYSLLWIERKNTPPVVQKPSSVDLGGLQTVLEMYKVIEIETLKSKLLAKDSYIYNVDKLVTSIKEKIYGKGWPWSKIKALKVLLPK